jgi:hypothetical protein
MRFSDFVSYSRKEQEMLVRDWIDNTDFAKGMLLMGHSEERHCELTEKELLDRVIEDNVSSSTFETKKDEEFNAKEILYFHTNAIIDWLTKGSNEFQNRNDYRRIILSGELWCENSYDDIVCKGIDKDLNEKETSVAKIVIERNRNVSTQNGKFFCYIKTFYPDIEHETARKTGRNFKKEALEKLNTESLPNTQKALWTFRMAGFPVVKREDIRKGACVIVPFRINGFCFGAEFDNNSANHKNAFMNVQTTMPNGEVKFSSFKNNPDLPPDVAKAAQRYGNYLKEIFDAVAKGEKVENVIDNISEPIIPYDIRLGNNDNWNKDTLQTNDFNHDEEIFEF